MHIESDLENPVLHKQLLSTEGRVTGYFYSLLHTRACWFRFSPYNEPGSLLFNFC